VGRAMGRTCDAMDGEGRSVAKLGEKGKVGLSRVLLVKGPW